MKLRNVTSGRCLRPLKGVKTGSWRSHHFQAGCRIVAADCPRSYSLDVVWPFIKQGVASSQLNEQGTAISSGHLSGRVSHRRSWLCRELLSGHLSGRVSYRPSWLCRELLSRLVIYQSGCRVVSADCAGSLSGHLLGRVIHRPNWLCRELLSRLTVYQAGCRVVAADCAGICSLVYYCCPCQDFGSAWFLGTCLTCMINSPFKEIFPDYQEKLFDFFGAIHYFVTNGCAQRLFCRRLQSLCG